MQYSKHLDFEQLVEENKHKLFRICHIYAISPQEPQDLFQEVLFQIWKSLDSFKEKSSIDTWMYRIAVNVCLRSKLKLEKRKTKTVRFDAIQWSIASEAITEEDTEKYQLLRDCIVQLNESDTSIIVLYLEDVSYKDIAAITGLTENHIAVKMKRIRKKLLECMKPVSYTHLTLPTTP